jgi:hypothetical protein
MDEQNLKNKLQALVLKVGSQRVRIALQIEGLSPRQAELLSLGDHTGTFRRKTVTAVEAVLKKEGRAKAS